MITDITTTQFLGNAEYAFALTDEMIFDTETATGLGIGEIYNRAVTSRFSLNHLTEIVRNGLIGGGMKPHEALILTDRFVKNRPFSETLPLAIEILSARWGEQEETA